MTPPPKGEARLTPAQAHALDRIRARVPVGAENHGIAITCAGKYDEDAYNVWINWRTAEALERRGLVKLGEYHFDEGAEITPLPWEAS